MDQSPYRASVLAGPGQSRRPVRPSAWLKKGIVLGIVVFCCGLGFTLCGAGLVYVYVATQLPSPDTLLGRAALFKSVKFFDRQGELLYEMISPQGGRRTIVKLDQISPYVRQATVATEDKNFYRHVGVDPLSVLRAMWQNFTEGEIVSGASTITQQLARNVLLPPVDRANRTLGRKIKEIILATELERRYSKDTILETYLNEIYYGNVAYGIEAAAETYFGKSAASLNLAESALLAGLPQAPAKYDPFVDPQAAKRRQGDVLNLMVAEGYITAEQAKAAWAMPLRYTVPQQQIKAPHFVNYVRQQLESKYGPDVLYRTGLHIYTTLDAQAQAIAEEVIRQQVRALAAKSVSNGALVAMRPDTGEILAMVGSVDFWDTKIGGQVNVVLRLRQPGSAIKPITYLTALEHGWTLATVIADEPTSFPDGANPEYRPVNYDGRFHGLVSVRTALACSYNIPAVKALQFVGLPEMLKAAHRLGIRSLNRSDYGLSLTLGGGDVTLLELVNAYAAFANGGRLVAPISVLKVTDSQGRVIETVPQLARVGQQVMSPQHAYLITDVLADNEARKPAFGSHNVLEIGRPAAVKTGTTNDFRDNWTIGYTPDLVVGVWVGNNDNRPMQGVSGVTGAAPIWHDFMVRFLKNTPVKEFPRPEGIVTMEICADTGLPATETCRVRRTEIFDATQLTTLSTPTNAVTPPPVVSFAQVSIFSPVSDQVVSGLVDVIGRAMASNFVFYVLEYGEGDNPVGWIPIAAPCPVMVENGVLGQWDTRGVRNGLYTLRVLLSHSDGTSAEARVVVLVQNISPSIMTQVPIDEYPTPLIPVYPSSPAEAWPTLPYPFLSGATPALPSYGSAPHGNMPSFPYGEIPIVPTLRPDQYDQQ